MERNFPVNPIFRNFRATLRGTLSVPFAPQPGISGVFGRMQSAQCYAHKILETENRT